MGHIFMVFVVVLFFLKLLWNLSVPIFVSRAENIEKKSGRPPLNKSVSLFLGLEFILLLVGVTARYFIDEHTGLVSPLMMLSIGLATIVACYVIMEIERRVFVRIYKL